MSLLKTTLLKGYSILIFYNKSINNIYLLYISGISLFKCQGVSSNLIFR